MSIMVSMKWILLFYLLINIFALRQAICQESSNLTFDWIQGKDSSSVGVNYHDKMNLFSSTDSLYIIYYLNKRFTKEPSAFEKKCVFRDNKWYANIVVPNDAVSLMLIVKNENNKLDNNKGTGYWLPVTHDGVVSEGAYATIAYMYAGAWEAPNYNLSTQRDSARILFEQEFTLYPQSKRFYHRYYLSTLSKSGEKYKSELSMFESYNDLDQWELLMLTDLYKYKNNVEKTRFFNDRLFKTYPGGFWSMQINSMPLQKAFSGTDDMVKKRKAYEEFKEKYKTFEDDDTRRYIELRKGITMLSRLLPHFVEYDLEKEWLADVNELSDEFKIPTLAFGARSLNSNGNGLVAEKYAKMAVELMKMYLDTNVRKVTERLYYTDKEVRNIRESLLADYLYIYGHSLFLQKKYEQADTVLQQAALKYAKSTDITKNKLYLRCLIEAKQYKKAQSVMRGFMKRGKVDKEMDELMINLPIADGDKYDAEEAVKYVIRDKIRANIIRENIPDMVFRNSLGEKVSLSSYKGKIVILDFWASWCAPCIAGLGVLDKFRADNKLDDKVVIVCVNTLEYDLKGRNRANEIMASRNYSLVSLFDELNEAPKQARFTALPTRVFIDQSGQVRYRQTGIEGSETEQLAELAVIVGEIRK
ncbi:alkyl hydroperoxide reductase/thiol specific antioxidant/Mal allergen [Fibrella aestuarina BUZ 2]|uniref:Alkyl hydroperoxide reductase/thiol specific antioxidant/Mal allergen n=2 Tax=Fibrella TaxID=861914 RepID=I0K9P0_9BACT|nr:alkyl hydroperoxide reductase/thiol specific antioxidant/Mal allergen [Fibrella aestuarina BUZ 2]